MKRMLIVLSLLSFLLCGCFKPKTDSEFRVGDIVVHKLSGNEGQIVEVSWDLDGTWQYKVRFVSEQLVTDKSGNSVKRKMLVTEYMKDFELKAKEGH